MKVPREPSLGMRLEEVARGADGRGLVLVSSLEEGGNAARSGKVRSVAFAGEPQEVHQGGPRSSFLAVGFADGVSPPTRGLARMGRSAQSPMMKGLLHHSPFCSSDRCR